MNQINVAVSVFALLTMLIVLANITLEKTSRKRVSVYFRLTVSADILMLTSAIIMWIVIDSGNRNTIRFPLISIILLSLRVLLRRWHGSSPALTERSLR